jgi:GNAT superfamily N-acetyltransferase
MERPSMTGAGLEIEPFGREHWAEAAVVLARAHAADRAREPMLPARYEDPEAAYGLVERTCGPAVGVVASRGGRVVGYLAASFSNDTMENVAEVSTTMAAVLPSEGAETWRWMYAAAATQWLERGCFVHYVQVPSTDDVAVGAWFSLGFGQYSVFNWRAASPVRGPEAEVVIRQVGVEAFEEVWALRAGLRRYNATSPILHPRIERLGPAAERARETTRASMADSRNAYFVARHEGQPAGLMIFTPPAPDDRLTPDRSVYLWIAFVDEAARAGGVGATMVNRGLAWAREQGYEVCTVGYFSPNLLGARFWQRKGFMPLGYTLERRIDPRIAWAKD